MKITKIIFIIAVVIFAVWYLYQLSYWKPESAKRDTPYHIASKIFTKAISHKNGKYTFNENFESLGMKKVIMGKKYIVHEFNKNVIKVEWGNYIATMHIEINDTSVQIIKDEIEKK